MITAGPTWVPIDAVRVISNSATGRTGILLAEDLAKKGARVTLILGPVENCCIDKRIKVIRFSFFKELNRLLKNELKKKRYDIVLHSAAVSDYRPAQERKNKLNSHNKKLTLILKQTPKMIDYLRKESPCSFLIGFKFEPQASKRSLIKQARLLMRRAHLDLVVANSLVKNNYVAYLVKAKNKYGPFLKKERLSRGLIGLIEKII
ncbi:MAG: phosphopantothenoylcysteine decarboxylase [Candidatus Omnitrophica bacterium]|nr:phosphopantothenoylcysteine decarboxylase [Candidatus Omnitrophota bacterium]